MKHRSLHIFAMDMISLEEDVICAERVSFFSLKSTNFQKLKLRNVQNVYVDHCPNLTRTDIFKNV